MNPDSDKLNQKDSDTSKSTPVKISNGRSDEVDKETLEVVATENKSDQGSLSVSDDTVDSIQKKSDIVKRTSVIISAEKNEAVQKNTLNVVATQDKSDQDSLTQCVSDDFDDSVRKESDIVKTTPVIISTGNSKPVDKDTLNIVATQDTSDQSSLIQCVSDDSGGSVRKESDIVKTTTVATSTGITEGIDEETLQVVTTQNKSDEGSLIQCVSDDSDNSIRMDSDIVKTTTVAQASKRFNRR